MMKTTIPLLLSALLTTACASPPMASSLLASLRPEKVVEVDFDLSVPASVAYRNIFAKAQQCWGRSHRSLIVERDAFNTQGGFGQISVSSSPEILIPAMVMTVIQIYPDGSEVRIRGRSLKSKVRNFDPEMDLPNLKYWAEGKDIPCGQRYVLQAV